jgi:hemolysin D
MSEVSIASPTLRYTAWVLLLLVFSVVAGSWFAKTEIVARGSGRVLALGRTQTIQPQFDGKILEIKASDGAIVGAGEILVRLDPTQANADVERLSFTRDQARQQLALHEALLDALAQGDPADADFLQRGQAVLENKIPSIEIKSDVRGFLGDSLAAIAASAKEFDAQTGQLQANIRTAEAKIAKALQDRDLLQERVAKKGGMSEQSYLDIKREVATADQDINLARSHKQELGAQLNALQQSRVRYITTLRRDLQQKIAEFRNTVASTSADLHTARNRQMNSDIVSPVSGRIENLQVFTQGGFVAAGQTLMSVVPDSDGLEIETLFQNKDAGFLQAGQKVLIKLDAYPAERFGILKGKVVSVGADARRDETSKTWIYAARISPDLTFVAHGGKRYPVVPGMTGTIDVVTGERRVISYFFEPLMKTLQDGFSEQ